MQNLKIALIQSNVYWENIQANLSMFEEKIWGMEDSADIIVLPEMFSTGFTMSSEKLAEFPNLHTHRWMKQMAAQTGSLVLGSYITKDNNQYFNRLVWMEPSGDAYYYDKRHLFRMAEEDHHYSAGSKKLIREWKGWKIMPLICYDLRFPVWSRNKLSENIPDYDLLLYVANWPAPRVGAWDTLLKARAIENLCFSAGVNRVGTDGSDVEYNGHSAVYDYKGEVRVFAAEIEHVLFAEINKNELDDYRKKFPAWKDADNFHIL